MYVKLLRTGFIPQFYDSNSSPFHFIVTLQFPFFNHNNLLNGCYGPGRFIDKYGSLQWIRQINGY